MRTPSPLPSIAPRVSAGAYAALFSMGAEDPPPARLRPARPSWRARARDAVLRIAHAAIEQVPCEDVDMRPLPPRYARSSLQT